MVVRSAAAASHRNNWTIFCIRSWHSGFVLPDAEQALARLVRAAANREKLLLFGDYDADGISATAIFIQCWEQITGPIRTGRSQPAD